MTKFSIRPATLQDKEAVSALLKKSYSHLMASAYEKNNLKKILPHITKANTSLLDSGTYYVALSNTHEVVGCGGWTPHQPGTGQHKEKVAHIRHFAVSPDFTRKGVGRLIFNQCVLAARQNDFKKFECFSSLNAQFFYKSLGFDPIKDLVVDINSDVSMASVLMTASISPSQ